MEDCEPRSRQDCSICIEPCSFLIIKKLLSPTTTNKNSEEICQAHWPCKLQVITIKGDRNLKEVTEVPESEGADDGVAPISGAKEEERRPAHRRSPLLQA